MFSGIKSYIGAIVALLSLAFAQNTYTISGFVTDAKTGKSLADVNIVVEGTNFGAATREDGFYIIEGLSPGENKIISSMIGYTTMYRTINLKTDEHVNFTLDKKAVEMDPIQVKAKTEAREIQEQAIPVSVFRIDEIQGTVTSLNELLTKTAGVKVRSGGGAGSSTRMSVRGLEGKRIGIFVEGTPLNDQSDFVDMNEIPLDIIERVEVYKGIVPAKFGGSAIGGAVNIVLKEFPPHYTDLSYTMKSYNTYDVKLLHKRKLGDRDILVGAGIFYNYSDNDYTFNSPYNPDLKITRDHDAYEKIMGGLVLQSHEWWFDEVEIELVYIDTEKEIQGIEYNIQEAENNSNAYIAAVSVNKDNFLTEGLDLDLSGGFFYTIFKHQDKAMQRYNWDGTTYHPLTSYGGEIGTDANDSYDQKYTAMQKTNLNYIIDQNNSVNLNVLYNYAYGIPEDSLKEMSIGHKTDFKNRMHSIITGLNYETNFFGHRLTNSATLKHYYYSTNTTLAELPHFVQGKHIYHKNDIGFSNAIRYRFTPDFLIKAAYAYDVRLPAENELLGDGFLIMPAGDLEPERNNNINIGVMYDHTNFSNNRLQLEINVFYTKLDNMIRYVGGFLQSNYENFGEMKSMGVDFDFKYDLTSFLYLYANATYQDLRDAREFEPGSTVENPTYGDRMPNIPYFYYNTGFELHKNNLFGGKDQKSRFYFENSFVEEYFYDFEQSIYQERRIPRSSIFNMGLEHSFRNKNVIIGLQVNNIFDQEQITIFNRPMPGRTAAIKLRYIFK